ncbi:MAG: hypothetical protein F4156_03680 [Holophagales bacterium]|nr:hypothetical protein [Holophagales bacterium]
MPAPSQSTTRRKGSSWGPHADSIPRRRSMTTTQRDTVDTTDEGFTLIVDNKEYLVKSELLTGREIMKLAGIPFADGLIQLLPDGTQVLIGLDETVDLKQGDHFKRPPRFKRGMSS